MLRSESFNTFNHLKGPLWKGGCCRFLPGGAGLVTTFSLLNSILVSIPKALETALRGSVQPLVESFAYDAWPERRGESRTCSQFLINPANLRPAWLRRPKPTSWSRSFPTSSRSCGWRAASAASQPSMGVGRDLVLKTTTTTEL